MTIWFTADTHFEFSAIQTKLRKFVSCKEADDTILNEIKKYVKKDDILWILGDFAENCGKYRIELPRADCRIILGNHDCPNKCYTSFGKRMFYKKTIKINDDIVYLDHYPSAYWDQSHNGSYSLYGHLHSAREETLDKIWPDRRSMDVGVDNAKRLLGEWRPFSWEEIKQILKDRSGHDPVQWYKDKRGDLDK